MINPAENLYYIFGISYHKKSYFVHPVSNMPDPVRIQQKPANNNKCLKLLLNKCTLKTSALHMEVLTDFPSLPSHSKEIVSSAKCLLSTSLSILMPTQIRMNRTSTPNTGIRQVGCSFASFSELRTYSVVTDVSIRSHMLFLIVFMFMYYFFFLYARVVNS